MKVKKKFYQKWWFYLLVVFVIIAGSSSLVEDKPKVDAPEQGDVVNAPEDPEAEAPEVKTEEPEEEPEEAPKVSREFKSALDQAENYLKFMAFSKDGLYEQLVFEEYPAEAAQYAVDNINADWNEQALKKAGSYIDFMSFSDAGLYDQLLFEKFTPEQAQYAIDNLE